MRLEAFEGPLSEAPYSLSTSSRFKFNFFRKQAEATGGLGTDGGGAFVFAISSSKKEIDAETRPVSGRYLQSSARLSSGSCGLGSNASNGWELSMGSLVSEIELSPFTSEKK